MKKVIWILGSIYIILNMLPLSAEGFTAKDRKLLYEMNIRIQEMDKRLNQRIDDTSEGTNKRLDDLQTFLQIITAVFSALILGTLSFAFWDRKTTILKAKEETLKEINVGGNVKKILPALRELAKTNKSLNKILKQHRLL